MEALSGVNVGLAALAFILFLVFLYVRHLALKRPTARRALHALKKATVDWSIPYSELYFGKLLGKGSQGEVFVGEWRGTTVAVKKVDTSQVAPEIVEEFCQEAEIMRRLRHPCVTLFMGVSIQYPNLCIVTEIVERGSLFDLLRDDTIPMPWTRRLQLALDIAQGMQYLHQFEPPILHRDLKSLNILVDRNWRGKVADFGMTRFQQEGTMTQCGSPLWMAPEMIKNEPYDQKADVYSFGIVLWELYTRKIPYRGTGLKPSKLVVKVVKEDFRPTIPLRCPLLYVRLVESCWHPIPDRRPTFKKIVKTLQEFLADSTMINHKPMAEKEITLPKPIEDDADQKKLEIAWTSKSWRVDSLKEVKLENEIGQGRSATVFKAMFRGINVAIKRWTVNCAAGPTRQEIDNKISDIMEHISNLRHPNIVLFMGAYFEPLHVGMIVEYMERGTLKNVLADEKIALDWDTMLQFLIDAAQGMVYLHANKPPILHGDLKSNRLLVNANWRVKISGYGIVDFASTIQSVTRSPWMAPEVLTDPASGCAASNVYSFGYIVWEVLTRKIPFGDVPFTDDMARRIVGGLRPTIPDTVHPRFKDLICACWQPDPTRRPSFAEILDVLQTLKEEGPPKITMDPVTAKHFRKARTVFAYRSKDPITIEKEWGRNRGKAGCYVILNGEDDVYLCEPEIFGNSYLPVPGRESEFRKTGNVLAQRMEQPFVIRTANGLEHGSAGDFIVQNDAGDQWVIEQKTFNELYEPDTVSVK